MDTEMVLNDETSDNTTCEPSSIDGINQVENDKALYPVLNDDEEEISEAGRAVSRSRSPMQEVVQLEHRWQGFIHKLDEILSTNGNSNFTQASFCAIFSQENTLTICFKLFDWENTGGIKQQKFVDSVRFTLRGSGSQDWIDLVDVLAFVVCGEHNHIKERDFKKILTSKTVLEKLYKLVSKDCDGCVNKSIIMDLIANLTYARPREKFTKENLEHLERMFTQTLGGKNELTYDDFKKIVHSRNSFFAERVFQVFDRDKSGTVSLCEFLDAMHQFTGKSPNEKLQFLFRIYDLDGDGLIQREELGKVMKACMEENGMTFSDEQIEDLTSALFEDADTENRGEISFEDLKAQIEKHPGLLENLSISIDRWLLPPSTETVNKKKKAYLPYQLTLPYLKNNYVYVIFLLFFILVNVALFVDRALTIAATGANVYYILARACGQCLNFNCAFILVLMLRHSLTYLRSRGASSFLPLDQSIYFHKMCGFVILGHSLLHTIMHLINFSSVIVYDETINENNYTAAEWLFTAKPGLFGLVPGWANPTGIILIVSLIIMVICSLPFVRKSGSFQVFYWTHLLYVLFFFLAILHAPNFWKWFIVPGVIFLLEKICRALQMSSGYRKTYISSGILLPSRVIHLVVQKPQGFHFHPGDYVYVNVPKIAKYEWHPFTISSAPEQEDAVWLHVRAVGQWTDRLFDYFQKQHQDHDSSNIHKLSNLIKEDTKIIMEGTSFNKSSEIADSKNGVVNISFQPEVSDDNQTETEKDNEESEDNDESDTVKEMVPSRPIRLKRNVAKTTSVPDFEKKLKKREKNLIIRNYFRTNSDNSLDTTKMIEARRNANINGSAMLFPTNRSVARSIRYMRKKPAVVTLDLPEDASGTEDEGANEEGKVSQDPAINLETGDISLRPKPTVVRLTSARIFRRKKTKNIDQDSRRAKRQSRMKEAESLGQCAIGEPLVVYLDGAYGAPSSYIFRAQHAVLIGTGIGVTPFASILQSIMHRYLKARQTCPNCCHAWTADMSPAVMNLRKVDFFWINRDQRSFEWFVNLLSQLEIEQAEQGGVFERFLDMHMYITSALQKTDMKAVGLQLAMDLLHEKEKRDLITGLKTRTNVGRPNWDKVFKQLTNQKKGKITVFYCGPPALGRILRYKSAEYGFEFKKEIF